MELNQQQVAGWLRVTLSAGGPIAALILSKTGMSSADWALYTEAALVVVPGFVVAIWSWYRNRKSTQIKLVDKMPEIAAVVVKDEAGGKVGDLARSSDPQHVNIVTESQNQSDALGGDHKPTTAGD